jgi:type IV secretion system protein VirB9
MVFDNGRFTWFKFPKLQDLPPIFAIDPTSGEAQLMSFTPRNGYFIVPALLPGGALLKLGKEEVRIKNLNAKGECGGFFQRDCSPVANIRN